MPGINYIICVLRLVPAYAQRQSASAERIRSALRSSAQGSRHVARLCRILRALVYQAVHRAIRGNLQLANLDGPPPQRGIRIQRKDIVPRGSAARLCTRILNGKYASIEESRIVGFDDAAALSIGGEHKSQNYRLVSERSGRIYGQ